MKIMKTQLKQLIREEIQTLIEGYTLYWNKKVEFTDQEWAKLLQATKKILNKAKKYGIVIAGPLGTGKPQLTKDHIAINGDAKEGLDYETFYLSKSGNDKNDWGFTKTQRRPYDAVVSSILYAAKKINKNLDPSSDDGERGIRDGGTGGWG